MPSSCLRSTLLCPSRGMGEGGECRSYSSRRKTVRKYYMRPQTLGEARRQRRNISRNSFFHRHVLTGRPQWAAGALVLIPLQCWDSRHQWLTHAGSWLTLAFFHPKLFLFFFFLLLQWISSCFFQIQSVDEIAVLLSQSFLDLFKVRSQWLKSKQRGTF